METILRLKVSTGKRVFSMGFNKESGILNVGTKNRPTKGKANDEIQKELKRFFGATTLIVFGQTSDHKVVNVALDREEVMKKLLALPPMHTKN